MSNEDDTFEIDIYGDEGVADETAAELEQQEYDDQQNGNEESHPTQPQDETRMDTGDNQNSHAVSLSNQGKKRKHESDEQHAEPFDQAASEQHNQSIDPYATAALKVTELHWWTTEEDLRAFCAQAQVEEELQDLAFGEHKINGKSKGEAYLEFRTTNAAAATKKEIERASQIKEDSGLRKTPFVVAFTSGGNPHRSAAANGVKKEYPQNTGRGGSYNNNFSNNRGGYNGRGNYNNRGGGYNNHNMQQRQASQNGGWGMNGMGGGNFGGGGGFGVNPMMQGGYGNMGMGNFSNMGRGGMMGNMNMMGRGGFNGMGNMGNMGMGMGMGNMNMGGMMGGGRGGGMMGGGAGSNWSGNAGGFQQQQGGFNGGMQQGNKRAKME